MDISVTTNPSRWADYIKAQTNTVQAEKKTDSPAPVRTQDEVVISSEAREILAKQGTDSASSVDAVSEEQTIGSTATTFTTFAEEFSKITRGYSEIQHQGGHRHRPAVLLRK